MHLALRGVVVRGLPWGVGGFGVVAPTHSSAHALSYRGNGARSRRTKAHIGLPKAKSGHGAPFLETAVKIILKVIKNFFFVTIMLTLGLSYALMLILKFNVTDSAQWVPKKIRKINVCEKPNGQ